MKLRVLDLFSGIGGFSLGLERTGGFETAAFCEIEDFPRRVLAKHWPKVRCYNDVRELTAGQLVRDGIGPIDVITGGFPCQDISTAGKQAGIAEGTRSGLWSEIVRLIGELRPRYVIVENVANLLRGPSERPGAWFGRVLGDLAECGYDAEWENIPASALGAPHRRERVWIVAYPNSITEGFKLHNANGQKILEQECPEQPQLCRGKGNVFSYSYRMYEQGEFKKLINEKKWSIQEDGSSGSLYDGNETGKWPIEPSLGRVANGVPRRVDRLKGLGNAVIPQIPELIGRAILASLTPTPPPTDGE